MVVGLCKVLEKVLSFIKLFERIRAVWLNERLDILREDVKEGVDYDSLIWDIQWK